jgi:hypothetical protein
MQFSTILLATLAAVASASPMAKRDDCPEVDNIPICGVSCLFPSLFPTTAPLPVPNRKKQKTEEQKTERIPMTSTPAS